MNHSKNYFIFSLLLIWIGFGCANKTQPETQPPPNILLIMTDDQGWGDLSFHGNDSITTPHIDALAQQSVQFDRFYVSPLCAPTRASLLTGRYHLRTGTSWVTHRKEVMRAEETTMAEILKDEGYATGLFGKWHNGAQYPNDPNGQGFEEFYGFTAGHWNNYFNTSLSHNGTKVETEGYISDVFTDKAIEFIEANSSAEGQKPFFCYVPYNAPHGPFQVPDKYFDKYKAMGLTDKNAAVYGMVENIDDNVGRLMQTLEAQNILENTIVIFLTDNGPNGHRYNGGMRGVKGHVHEGGVRVPCFMSWKDQLPAGKVVDQIAAHFDLLPTLLELADIETPATLELDGKSLVPLLQDIKSPWPKRKIYSIQTDGKLQARPASVRTDEHRLVIDRQGNVSLFDMLKDPEQKNDISDQNRLLTEELKFEILDWFKEVTKHGITPPIVQVGYKESPNTILPAHEATLDGEVKFKGVRGWANDYIIDWNKKGDKATWEIDIPEIGDYNLVLKYNCSKEFLNAKMHLRINNHPFDINIRQAAEYDFLPSPDRIVRGEVYEKEWESQSIRRTSFGPVKRTISIELAEDQIEGWLEVKELLVKFEGN